MKKQSIEIELLPTKKDLNLSIKEIYEELINIKENIKDFDIIKKENKELKNKVDTLEKGYNELKKEINILKTNEKEKNKETENLKSENKQLKEELEQNNKEINNLKEKFKKEKELVKENANNENSVIMKDEEKYMISQEIEYKMNKQIKMIKKLYQATIDGGEPSIFHFKCDNIPNTLILVKSEGLRRFGGFIPIPWKSEKKGILLEDPEMKTFVFSLDKKKYII